MINFNFMGDFLNITNGFPSADGSRDPSAELIIANKELLFQNGEKEKRAAELLVANAELAFQNKEKEDRAAELIIANKELLFQNGEKEKRAAELLVANAELAFQNSEKEKRAAELIIANKELLFQNGEKEDRAAELIIANKELLFQNGEKEKRAAELLVANAELAFQNSEKEKRAAELLAANKELLAFTYVSSHDMQEPLRKIQSIASILLEKEVDNLSEKGKDYFRRLQLSAKRMQQLIRDLLAYSRTNAPERHFELTDLNIIIEDVKADLQEVIEEKNAMVEIKAMCPAYVIPFQFHQLFYNLIGNSIKFSDPAVRPLITISSEIVARDGAHNAFLPPDKNYCHILIADNGIGFEPEFSERIFEVFQKLHRKEDYPGTGIGLAIVKKIVDNHNGFIVAVSELRKGAAFHIYIPEL